MFYSLSRNINSAHNPQVVGTESASPFNGEYTTVPIANVATNQTSSASSFDCIPPASRIDTDAFDSKLYCRVSAPETQGLSLLLFISETGLDVLPGMKGEAFASTRYTNESSTFLTRSVVVSRRETLLMG